MISGVKMAVVSAQNNSDGAKPKHGKVILLLENCILPPERLLSTPSNADGLDINAETDLRILGCELIQTSGKLLRLPQVAMATGQVLFHRFYFSKSFVRHSMEIVAMACITLASKIEEAPRRIRDVVNIFHHIKQVKGAKNIQPLILDQNYINLKNQVIKAERRVLKELGFCVHVKHPHKIIVTLLQVLDCEKNMKLMQAAWNYMNDSLRTDIFVRYSPETIACACIYLSARLLQIPLPNQPPWYAVFNVQEEDIQDTCRRVLAIYCRKPDSEALEKKVEELKKAHLEAKLRAKLASGTSTPTLGNGSSFSPSSRNNSPRQSPTLDSSTKKKEETKPVVERSPRVDRTASNHIPGTGTKRKASPSSPSPVRSRKETSRQGHSSSSSSGSSPPTLGAPLVRGRTPPRSYKDSGSGLSSPVRSKLEDGRSKDSSNSKRHSSHKRKRSISSRSRSRSPSHRHGSKKSSTSSHRSSRHKSPSGHSEHNHRHHRSSSSKKERSREGRNHRTAITARR
ncbi:cyclin-L1 [Dermacentor variabilis]|uniref:cyclin-L1 n=1 Tax=Dermacentor variabilis TaxID=34621 RepID=UPI003F5BA4E0